jgi:hypothetical protein
MKWEMPGLQSERMTINERAELHSEDELVYCSDRDRYVLRTRNVTYGAHRYVKNVYIAESGIIGGSEYTREDSGSLSEEYEPSEKFSRLSLSEDGKTVRLNGLPDTKADDWITITEKTEDENFGVRSQTENKKTSTVLYSNFDDIWTGDFKVGSRSYTRRDGLLGVTTVSDTCEITSEHIAGTRKVKTASGSVSTLEFKFTIIIPLNKE